MNIFGIHHGNKIQQSNAEIKLPKIDPVNSKGMKLQLKSTTKLPNLKVDPQNGTHFNQRNKQTIRQPNTDLLIHSNKIRQRQKSQGDDFVTQVQKKLKIVLEQQNIADIEQSNGSDEEDFQEKINKNRQILKMRKIQRESQQHEELAQVQIQKQLQLEVPRKKKQSLVHTKKSAILQKQRSKNQSLYEKRIKDYKEMSLQNKFLLKKKQNFQKDTLFQQKKQKQEFTSITNNTNETNSNIGNFKSNKNTYKRKAQNSNQRQSTKLITSANVSVVKDEELFDNIHNILMNPSSNKKQNPEKVKETKEKRQKLEQKIKQLEIKLSEQKQQDKELIEKIRAQSNSQISALQKQRHGYAISDDFSVWRKIEVNNLSLKSGSSNFDHEIERVNKYFERNEKCIENYMENQKILVDMNTLRKLDEKAQTVN